MEILQNQICPEEAKELIAFAESRIGGRSENQDSYAWAMTDYGYLVTVCDGMGGGPGGKTASSIAVAEIIAGVKDALEGSTLKSIVVKAIQRANLAIINASSDNPQLQGMGSTATVLIVNPQSAVVAHVGDSRVYQIRDRKKIFRTFDHSMVFGLVKRGIITEEQARLSAESNIITRALGIKPDVEVDVQELTYEKGDRFILSSDGIHGAMPEKELISLCSKKSKSIGTVVDDIATYVDNIGNGNGNNHDNLTLAMVEMKVSSIIKPKMSRRNKILMYLLLAISIISIAVNCFLCSSNSSSAEIKSMNDSIAKLNAKDSINQQTIKEKDLQIDSLNKKFKEIQAIVKH